MNTADPPPASDEIYALSVFGADGPAFVSAAVVAEREAAAMEGGEHASELVGGRRGVEGGQAGGTPGRAWFVARGLREGVARAGR